jgi:hypothetical protein
MPRGLGDNPLKREKKVRKAASHRRSPAAPGASGSVSMASATPVSDGSADVSSSSTSYNDVFFQRRPESSPAANSVPAEVAVQEAEPVAPAAPIAAADAVSTEPAFPEVIASAAPEPQVEVHAMPVEPDLSPVMASPAPVPEPVPVAEQSPVPPVAVHEEKTGFFGRIFGKFRKS